MKLSLLSSALCAVFMICVPAQEAAPAVERNGDPVAGVLPGTERWIVHLAPRPFDLGAFRAAIRARRPAAEVADIVADLRDRAERHQRPVVQKVRSLGGAVVAQWWLINACAVDLPPGAEAVLTEMHEVARLERDRVWLPVMRAETASFNHASDQVQSNLGIDGSGVTVAIMDTGQDENVGGRGRPHRTYFPDGDPATATGPGIGGSRLIVNRQLGLLSPDDRHGHGTGVASIAAGADWGTGRGDDGHAPGARIAGYAIANRVQNGSTTTSVMVSAWQAIAADRAQLDIVAANLSYSGSPDPNNAGQIAIDSCAFNADVMTVVAGGNSSSSTRHSQGAANGLAIAAIVPTSHEVASFSSRGPLYGQPGRFYPDLSGCGVETAMAMRDDERDDWIASGTSMGAPQAAGAATLIRAAVPNLTALETKALLLATPDDISLANPEPPYDTRNAYGMGIVRDDRAVATALAGSHGTATTATSWTTNVQVTADRAFSAAVTWHRDPALGSTWSDLVLTLLDTTNQVVVRSDTPSNLYEVVRFIAAETATYTLRVDVQSLQSGLSTQEFGWSFAEVRLPPVAGSFTAFGQGCAPAPRLVGLGTPEAGQPFTLRLENGVPNSSVTLVNGFSTGNHLGVPLPLDLAPFGAPGCDLLISLDVLQPMGIGFDGSGFRIVPVPNDPTFVGHSIYYQVLAPTTSNTLGVATSNAGEAHIGGQR